MWLKKGNIFNKRHSQVPVVDTNNDGFWRIYYSTRLGEDKSKPMYVDIDPINKNIINESTHTILDLGDYGYFDWAGVMPTEIITVGDKKYLYYIGWSNRVDVPYHNNLGLAISNDGGNTYTKISKGPIFSTSKDEPGYIGTISILKIDNIYMGWYLSCRKWELIDSIMEPFYDIKLAISKNGINWSPTNKTCVELRKNEGGISQASVIKENGVFKMWYSYRNKSDYRLNKDNSYRIGMSISKDGYNWERTEDVNLDISESGWDDTMVCYPYVIKHNNKKIMFYNGNGFGKTGFGYCIEK